MTRPPTPLRALQSDSIQVDARSAALAQYGENYTIAHQRFDSGGISELALLEAQLNKLQGDLEQSRAVAQQLSDAAALLHAMAGPV